jgi:hypothetical protein
MKTMKIQPNTSSLMVNTIFNIFWHSIYGLAVLFLFVARIRLSIRDFFEVSTGPQRTGDLTVGKGLMETPVH